MEPRVFNNQPFESRPKQNKDPRLFVRRRVFAGFLLQPRSFLPASRSPLALQHNGSRRAMRWALSGDRLIGLDERSNGLEVRECLLPPAVPTADFPVLGVFLMSHS